MSGRTIFVGGTHAEAVATCREIGVNPYARTTRILLSAASADGLRITPEDRLLWGRSVDPRLAETVRRSLAKTIGVRSG